MPGRFRSTRARGPGKGSQSTNESAVSAEKDGDGDGEPKSKKQACQHSDKLSRLAKPVPRATVILSDGRWL